MLCILASPLSGQASDIFVRPVRYAVCEAGQVGTLAGRQLPAMPMVGTYRTAIDTTVIYIDRDFKAPGGQVVRRLRPAVVEPGHLPSDSAVLILPLRAKPTLFAMGAPWPVTLLLPDSTSRDLPPADVSRYGPALVDGHVSLIVRVPPASFRLLAAARAARLAIASDTFRVDGKLHESIRALYYAARCGWEYTSANKRMDQSWRGRAVMAG